MVDDATPEQDRIPYTFTQEQLEWFSVQNQPIQHVKKKYFPRLSISDTQEFIKNIFKIRNNIYLPFICSNEESRKNFYNQYKKKFTIDEKGKPYFSSALHMSLLFELDKLLQQLVEAFEDSHPNDTKDDEEEDTSEVIRRLDKYTTFDIFRVKLCKDEGKKEFYYDFSQQDIPSTPPQNTNELQRSAVQILTSGVKFDYPLVNIYRCGETDCQHIERRYAYETVSTNTKILCRGDVHYTTAGGEARMRRCKQSLLPDKELSKTKTAYYYEINYEDDTTKTIAGAIGFKEYKPGYYECVLFRLSNAGKTEMFLICDVRKIPPTPLVLPQQTDENYLFTLQKYFDDYIADKTGMRIFGLYPIKCAMIIQRLAMILEEPLMCNVMVVGDSSTGKSLVLKYYSFLLNNYYNLSTNGISVSIPGLRGTRATISLFGKDIKIVTIGHLGTYHTIHIDEAGENKELVQNLKTFLLESDYSYDKAGGTGVSNERTAQVNISQNLDHEHVGAYRGAIRKSYKELELTIGGMEKVDWDESWDLFRPIHEYEDNPQLKKVIREKRLEFKQKQIWWIDGIDYALHERFPFYFYLSNPDGQVSQELEVVNKENSQRKKLKKNLEVTRALHTEDIDAFFKSLSKYVFCDEDIVAYTKVDIIIREYGFTFDVRTKEFYYLVVRLSRVINQRTDYTEVDYNLVRWFLETTNRKMFMLATNSYTIKGPPDLIREQESVKQEEESKPFSSQFGIPDGEFEKFMR